MDKKYNVKQKVDGKLFTFGNVQPGQYGPRLGLKVSPQLRNMIANSADGGWINFNLYQDDGKYGQRQEQSSQGYDNDVGF